VLPYLWMLCGALSFACMGALTSSLSGECDWQMIVLSRAFLAMVFAFVLAKASGVRLVFLRPRTLWLRSIAGSVSMLCTFYALTKLPVADVFTLANVFPVWVALLSWPVLREKPSWGVWIAVISAVCGVALVQQPDASDVEHAAGASMIVLAGSFATAVAMLGLHRLRDIDVRAIVVHFSAVATLFCLAALFAFPTEHGWQPYTSPRVLTMLLGVGLAATIGQILLTKAFAAGNPAKVSVVALTQIGFGMIFDVVLTGRRFTATELAGMALVVIPTAWLMIQEATVAERAGALPLHFDKHEEGEPAIEILLPREKVVRGREADEGPLRG
jgi:drug/metabolite transporter (DMT)-like permease